MLSVLKKSRFCFGVETRKILCVGVCALSFGIVTAYIVNQTKNRVHYTFFDTFSPGKDFFYQTINLHINKTEGGFFHLYNPDNFSLPSVVIYKFVPESKIAKCRVFVHSVVDERGFLKIFVGDAKEHYSLITSVPTGDSQFKAYKFTKPFLSYKVKPELVSSPFFVRIEFQGGNRWTNVHGFGIQYRTKKIISMQREIFTWITIPLLVTVLLFFIWIAYSSIVSKVFLINLLSVFSLDTYSFLPFIFSIVYFPLKRFDLDRLEGSLIISVLVLFVFWKIINLILLCAYSKNPVRMGRWIIFITFLVSIVLFYRPLIDGDGMQYYAYVRSLFIDGDLRFDNEYEYGTKVFGAGVSMIRSPVTGRLWNYAPIGTSLLWSPFFIIGNYIAKLCHYFNPKIAIDGYSSPYIISITFGSMLFLLIGLILTFEISKDFFSIQSALFALLLVWFASPLFNNVYFHPSYSHAADFFITTLFLYTWYKTMTDRKTFQYLLLGILCGMMTLVRWQLILFTVLPFLEFFARFIASIKYKKVIGWDNIILKLGFFLFIVFLVGIIPQIMLFKYLYGVVSPYPLEKYTDFSWFSPQFFNVLFSRYHGLFYWTPAMFFSFIGLLLFTPKEKRLFFYFIIVLLLQIYLVGCRKPGLPIGGWCFGMRLLICCSLIFSVGLSSFLDRVKKHIPNFLIPLLITLFIIWNIGFDIQYVFGIIHPSGEGITLRRLVCNTICIVPELIADYFLGAAVGGKKVFSFCEQIFQGISNLNFKIFTPSLFIFAGLSLVALFTFLILNRIVEYYAENRRV